MTVKHRTIDGDVLDKIVLAHYGDKPGALEHVMAHNPALRHEEAVLPSGLTVLLPDYETQATDARVRLWS